jgi:hypothetical protein
MTTAKRCGLLLTIFYGQTHFSSETLDQNLNKCLYCLQYSLDNLLYIATGEGGTGGGGERTETEFMKVLFR